MRIGAYVVLAASILLAVAFAGRFGHDPNLVRSPLIGQAAPEVAVPLLDGSGEVSPAGFGGDILIVNFFASWCLECREEHDALVATADAFADAGVRVMQIAYQDEAADAAAFLQSLGMSPHTIYALDPGSRAAIAFGVFGVPETYLIDPDGIVRGKIQGTSNALLLGEAIDRIRRGEEPGVHVAGDVQSEPGET